MKRQDLTVTKQNNVDVIRYDLTAADVYDEKINDKVTSLPNVFSFQYSDQDGKRSVTSYANLETTLDMFMKETLNKKQVCCVLSGVLAAFEIGAQGIPVANIVREPEYMYVDKESLAVKCILVPLKQNPLPLAEIPAYFKKLVIDMKFSDDDKDNYVARIISMLNNPEFSSSKFRMMLDDELKNMNVDYDKVEGLKKAPKLQAAPMPPMGAPMPPMGTPVPPMASPRPMAPNMPQGNMPPMNGPQGMPGGPRPMGAPMPPMGAPVPPMAPPRPMAPNMPQGNMPPMNGPQGMPGGPRPMGAPMPPMAPKPPVMPAPTPVPAPVPEAPKPPVMPAPTPVPAPVPEAPKPPVMPAPAPVPTPVAPAESTDVTSAVETAPAPAPAPSPSLLHPMQAIKQKEEEESTASAIANMTATDLLPENDEIKQGSILGTLGGAQQGSLVGQLGSKPIPHIVRKKTGETINITKSEFAIGKSKTKADYAIENNNAISRVHCIIVQKDGVNYIKDNNSTNHTFVNGVEIEPNKEFLLKNKTVIQLGDEEFTFLLRKSDQ